MSRDRRYNLNSVQITLGDGHVVIRDGASSAPVIAGVLSIDHDTEGRPVRIWLDRLVFPTHVTSADGWRVWGAVSTVLERD